MARECEMERQGEMGRKGLKHEGKSREGGSSFLHQYIACDQGCLRIPREEGRASTEGTSICTYVRTQGWILVFRFSTRRKILSISFS